MRRSVGGLVRAVLAPVVVSSGLWVSSLGLSGCTSQEMDDCCKAMDQPPGPGLLFLAGAGLKQNALNTNDPALAARRMTAGDAVQSYGLATAGRSQTTVNVNGQQTQTQQPVRRKGDNLEDLPNSLIVHQDEFFLVKLADPGNGQKMAVGVHTGAPYRIEYFIDANKSNAFERETEKGGPIVFEDCPSINGMKERITRGKFALGLDATILVSINSYDCGNKEFRIVATDDQRQKLWEADAKVPWHDLVNGAVFYRRGGGFNVNSGEDVKTQYFIEIYQPKDTLIGVHPVWFFGKRTEDNKVED